MTFADLPLFAPIVRDADPMTSKLAARDVLARAGTQQAKLLRAFDRYRAGLTAAEAGECADLAHTGYWKRVSELERIGLLEDTGTTRVGPAGSRQRVLRITGRGVEAARGAGA